MTDENKTGITDTLVEGYNRMLKRLNDALDSAREGEQAIKQGIDDAMEKATELGELTQEEALKVGDYLKRDLKDAAEFLADSGQELRDWLRFDIDVVEQELASRFANLVDRTRVELQQFELQATLYGEWHTGEITGIGTLQCKSCGENLHFHKPSHIPPCPKCHGTKFRRVSKSD